MQIPSIESNARIGSTKVLFYYLFVIMHGFDKHAIFTLYQYGMYIAIMLAHKTLTRKETIMRVQLCIEVITFDVENTFILSFNMMIFGSFS